jgi:RimJ/RimL family protein N-acetyltransferase
LRVSFNLLCGNLKFFFIKAFLRKYFKRTKQKSNIPTLDLDRLVLRPFSYSDAKRVQLLAGDEAIASGAINIPHPYLDGLAESWINSHNSEFKKGNSLILAMTKKDSDTLIGSIGLYINSKHKHAELGYWIGRDYWGNGYCSEAVAGIINYAFEKLLLNKIFAYFLTRNLASGKVLIKNGFKKEGSFRQHVLYKEKFEDIECYSLLKAEYKISRN